MPGSPALRVTILLAALLLSGGAVKATAGEPRRCATKHARDLAADTRGRIYEVGRKHPRRWYACLRSRDRPVFIGSAESGTQLRLPRVASPYAVASVLPLDPGGPLETLMLIDMRRTEPTEVLVSGGVEQLVLSKHGVAVFVNASTDGRTQVVRRTNGRGEPSLLDTGNIAGGSLGLSADGRRVYWVKDGVAQSATL